jgi:hypothetical protein
VQQPPGVVLPADRDLAGEHLVRLFDDRDSRVESVAAFLTEAYRRGGTIVVVACPEYWVPISRRLEADGCPVEALIASGRLLVCDAATTLGALMVDGVPREDRFAERVGTLVRRLYDVGENIWAYGEMVDLLAARGEYYAAECLEAHWNALRREVPFTLLCGYSSVSFGDPRTADALRAICNAHSHATAPPDDLLATWLLSRTATSRTTAAASGA